MIIIKLKLAAKSLECSQKDHLKVSIVGADSYHWGEKRLRKLSGGNSSNNKKTFSLWFI